MMLSMVVASRIVFSRLREPPSWSITPFSFVRYAFLISSAASVLGRISEELVYGHVGLSNDPLLQQHIREERNLIET